MKFSQKEGFEKEKDKGGDSPLEKEGKCSTKGSLKQIKGAAWAGEREREIYKCEEKEI